jgi:hypothetical protein
MTKEKTMNAVGVLLERIDRGWAVTLTDGRELARFTGHGAKRRALRYVADRGVWRQREGAM